MYPVSCTNTHHDVTDLDVTSLMVWLKIQKFECLEDGTYFFFVIKKFLTCASDDTFLETIVF